MTDVGTLAWAQRTGGTIIRDEANRQPRCRGHFAENVLQFGLMVRLFPWT